MNPDPLYFIQAITLPLVHKSVQKVPQSGLSSSTRDWACHWMEVSQQGKGFRVKEITGVLQQKGDATWHQLVQCINYASACTVTARLSLFLERTLVRALKAAALYRCCKKTSDSHCKGLQIQQRIDSCCLMASFFVFVSRTLLTRSARLPFSDFTAPIGIGLPKPKISRTSSFSCWQKPNHVFTDKHQ